MNYIYNFKFLFGSNSAIWPEDTITTALKNSRVQSQPPSVRSISNNSIILPKKANMVRSFSQDMPTAQPEHVIAKQNSSYSDTSLNNTKVKPFVQNIQNTIKEQPVNSEEEIYSTDSSVIDEETKKKKRKLFSGFSKKNKKTD